MNKTWIKEHWLEILLCVGIVIQIGALAVFNLTRLPYESIMIPPVLMHRS